MRVRMQSVISHVQREMRNAIVRLSVTLSEAPFRCVVEGFGITEHSPFRFARALLIRLSRPLDKLGVTAWLSC